MLHIGWLGGGGLKVGRRPTRSHFTGYETTSIVDLYSSLHRLNIGDHLRATDSDALWKPPVQLRVSRLAHMTTDFADWSLAWLASQPTLAHIDRAHHEPHRPRTAEHPSRVQLGADFGVDL